MDSSNATGVVVSSIVNSPLFLVSMSVSVVCGTSAAIANSLMLLIVPKTFRIYQRSLKVLLQYSSLVYLMLSTTVAAKCSYLLFKTMSGGASQLATTALDCMVRQDAAISFSAVQAMFATFALAFERLVASQRAATYANSGYGGKLAAACILSVWLLSAMLLGLGVYVLLTTPHGARVLPVCVTASATPPSGIIFGAVQSVLIGVVAVYCYVALRRSDIFSNCYYVYLLEYHTHRTYV